MRYLSALLVLVLCTAAAAAQSGRTAVKAVGDDRPVRELFNEANGFRRLKFEEFEKKKLPVTTRLREQTEREQKQLAAKLAATAETRADLSTDDLYYLALLHWISENLDATAESLDKYLATGDTAAERVQTALSLKTVVAAKQKRFDDATSALAEYKKLGAGKPSELLRMNSELAKALLVDGKATEAALFAEDAFAEAKSLAEQPAYRAAGLDLAYDNALVLFDAHRNAGNIAGAESALERLRQLAGKLGNSTFFYYAADKLITYRIETGRKPLALETFVTMLIAATKELPLEGQRTDAINRLKRREKHYKLLGETAPEFLTVDKWFPGSPAKMAELKGKVVLIDFWATWCAPCFDAFPALIEWQRDFADDGFVILGFTRYYGRGEGRPVNETEEIAFLERFREKQKLPYDIIVGKDQSTQLLYGAAALPTAVLVDRKGTVRYIEIGTSSSRLVELREMILKLLSEK